MKIYLWIFFMELKIGYSREKTLLSVLGQNIFIYGYIFFNFRIECVQFGNVFGRPNKYKEHMQKKGPSHNDQCAQCLRKFLTHKEYKMHVVDEHYVKWKYKCFFTVYTFVLPIPMMFFNNVYIVFFVLQTFS